ncbi:MAG: ABC transporter ATP-binding protein [Clostridia bacterium]|nr:ABC transporter ATP-binding protein [Clostridia bacterium]
MKDKNVLIAQGITKTFDTGAPTEVLKGIDLEVNKGEFVAIVGESGSGKSTLLYILAGIDTPTEGSVVLADKDLATIGDAEMASLRRHDVAFVYQYDNLVPHLTAYENVTLPLLLDGLKEADYKDRVIALMTELGIGDRLKNYPNELSGGEQQRVAIARALAINPKLIFLDEPTGSLDRERGRQVMEILKDVNEKRGVALVMVTHSSAHAEYASRRIEIEDGRIK